MKGVELQDGLSKIEVSTTPEPHSTINKPFKWKEALFLTTVALGSMIGGFSVTFNSAKKKDPGSFEAGMNPTSVHETGARLATRALKYGTLYSVTGCGILFYCIWKAIGAKDLQEFRYKVGQKLPVIPKNDPPQGRTEFSGLNDLLQYIIDEDEKMKKEKSSKESIVGEKK